MDGVISLTFGDLERSDQGHLLKNTISVRDSAIDMIEHLIVTYRSRIGWRNQFDLGWPWKVRSRSFAEKHGFCER